MKDRDMSNEEALYAIFSAIEMGDKIDAGRDPYYSVLVCAEKALEKQIAKSVECKGWKGYRNTRYKCPTCEKIIRCGYEYCSNCGQAVKFPKTKLVDGKIVLDWSEED